MIPLDWWPVTRDCLAYGITVSILICIIHDERIEWYEALILVFLYVIYILIMYFDKTIQKWVKGKFCYKMLVKICTSALISGSLKQVREIRRRKTSTENGKNNKGKPKCKTNMILILLSFVGQRPAEENSETNVPVEPGNDNNVHIINPSHLNGSLKPDNLEIFDDPPKLELSSRDVDEELPFYKWPVNKGKFGKVSESSFFFVQY